MSSENEKVHSAGNETSKLQSKKRRKAPQNWTGPRSKQVLSEAASLLRLGGIPRELASLKSVTRILRQTIPRHVQNPFLLRLYPKAYKDKATGKSMGFAILVCDTKKDGDDLIEALNGKTLAEGFVADLSHRDFASVPRNPHLRSSNDDSSHREEPWDGLDPPLRDQMKPLSLSQIRARVGCEADSTLDWKAANEKLLCQWKDNPRPRITFEGAPVLESLLTEVRELLLSTVWPGCSFRGSVNAENYIVLKIDKEKKNDSQNDTSCTDKDGLTEQDDLRSIRADDRYEKLKKSALEILRWADPDYPVSAIALTKNFVGSPHCDSRDTRYQYAISVGDFDGGELCIESTDGSTIYVVNTRNRMVRVDGRCVHWVRPHHQGDRYSLIYYCSYDDKHFPIEYAIDETFKPANCC